MSPQHAMLPARFVEVSLTSHRQIIILYENCPEEQSETPSVVGDWGVSPGRLLNFIVYLLSKTYVCVGY